MGKYNNSSYDRDRNNNNNGYNDRNYSASGNRSNYNNGGNRNSSAPKKHSGCSATVASKGTYVGSTVVTGWNYSRRHGMVTFLAAPYSKSEVRTSKTGRQWVNYMVKVQPEKAASYIVSGLLEVATKRVIIKEMGMVMNPKGGRGGYCGKFGGN